MLTLELTGVSKSFGAKRALRDVSLSLPEGSALGLLGPNGAGKTTALRILLGFARPDEGSVRLNGLAPSEAASRVGVGYLPERLTLPGRMSVRAFLELHATLAGLAGSERSRSIDEVLEQTGIADRAADRIAGLSKGLAQRVGFAQAFVGSPRLLLLDEPTSGLDPIGVRDARDWILAARERGCSLLVSSHILSEIERTCDQVAILHEGSIAASGDIRDIVQGDESLEDAFVRVVSR
jgi:ABC-2 type transport system ATP-binding protein